MFSNLEIIDLRKNMYSEVKKFQPLDPEARDFDMIKTSFISKIAYEIWVKLERPVGKDMDIWLEAEHVWDYIRYMW